MEKEEKKREELLTRTTTPSFSRQLPAPSEMERILEGNEEEEEPATKLPKEANSYNVYDNRKHSELFLRDQLAKKDSESIVNEVEKQSSCCIKKFKKNSENLNENPVCKMPCRIF